MPSIIIPHISASASAIPFRSRQMPSEQIRRGGTGDAGRDDDDSDDDSDSDSSTTYFDFLFLLLAAVEFAFSDLDGFDGFLTPAEDFISSCGSSEFDEQLILSSSENFIRFRSGPSSDTGPKISEGRLLFDVTESSVLQLGSEGWSTSSSIGP